MVSAPYPTEAPIQCDVKHEDVEIGKLAIVARGHLPEIGRDDRKVFGDRTVAHPRLAVTGCAVGHELLPPEFVGHGRGGAVGRAGRCHPALGRALGQASRAWLTAQGGAAPLNPPEYLCSEDATI